MNLDALVEHGRRIGQPGADGDLESALDQMGQLATEEPGAGDEVQHPSRRPHVEDLTVELDAAHDVLGVEHQRRVLGDRRGLELVVVDQHDDEIGRGEDLGSYGTSGNCRSTVLTSGMYGSQNTMSAPLAARRSPMNRASASRWSFL